MPQGNGSTARRRQGRQADRIPGRPPGQTQRRQEHSPNQIREPRPAVAPTHRAEPMTATATNPARRRRARCPGLAVLSILDNVQSAGAPPDWSPNGETLAFSAMPDDESRGPDVYVWSPGDAKARAITTDHKSYLRLLVGQPHRRQPHQRRPAQAAQLRDRSRHARGARRGRARRCGCPP